MKLCIIKKDLPEVDEAWHSAKEDMRNEHIKKYIEKHGYHFTDKLAEHASKSLVNRNKKDTQWTADNISSLVKSLGVSIPGNATRGDICYSANMYYSDSAHHTQYYSYNGVCLHPKSNQYVQLYLLVAPCME